MRRIGLIVILTIGLFFTETLAQDPQPCGSPVLTQECFNACVMCDDLSGVSLNTIIGGGGSLPPGYCTAIQHTAHWIGFAAGSASVGLEVTVDSCVSGVGIEMGIYEGNQCQNFNLVSNCNTFMPPGTYNFTAAPLTPGCYYWIVFDNNGPAECYFTFNVTSGTIGAGTPSIGSVNGGTSFCINETGSYSAESPEDVCGYNWTVTGGNIIVGDPTSDAIDVLWSQAGTWEVCVTPENACEDGVQVCQTVEVFPEIPITNVGPIETCEGEPYFVDGVPYYAGVHTINLTSQNGCDSTVILTVNQDPLEMTFLQETVCAPECVQVGNQTFCDIGVYDVTLQQQSFPNCDSLVTLDLNVLEVDADALVLGQLTCDNTEVTLNGGVTFVSGIGDVEYVWTNEDGDEIGFGESITVSEAGEYTLTVTITSFDGQVSCTDATTVEVMGNAQGPELEFNDVPVICAGESISLDSLDIQDLNDADGTLTFHTDTPADAGNELNNPEVSPTNPTTYYVLSTAGACTDEIPITIDVAPSPDIEADGPFEICEGDMFILDSVNIDELNMSNGTITFYSALPVSDSTRIDSNFIVPDSTGMFYVQSANGGCSDIDSFMVEVIPIPEAQFTVESPICVGDISMIEFTGMAFAGLNYSWDFDGATGGDPNLEGPHMLTWNTPGTKEILLETTYRGCVSGVDTMFVEVEDSLRSPIINCVTTESSVEFTWNSVNGAGGYNVIVISGQSGNFVDDTTYLVDNLVPNEEVIIEIEAIGTNSCGSNYTQISCTAMDCPPLDIQLDGPGSICMDSSATVDIMAMIPGSGTGVQTWSGPGIMDPSSGVVNVADAGVGTHTIVLEYTENGCDYAASEDLEILPIPVAAFSLASPVCEGDQAMATYSGTAGGSANAFWDFDNGQATPGNGLTDQSITWSQEGQYTVSLYIEDQGCISDTVTETVTVDRPLDAPVITCETTLTSITFSWDPVLDAGGYQVNVLSGPMGTMLGDSAYVVDGLTAGDEVEIEVIALSDNSCPNSMASVICDAIDCPPIDLQIDPVADPCFDPNVQPVQLTASGDIQGGTITWSGNGISDPVAGMFDPLAVGPGTYTITVTYEESVCEYMETTTITVHDLPVVDAGADQVLDCGTQEVTIGSTNTASGPGIEYSWSHGATTLQTTVSSAGNYTLQVTDTNTGCVNTDEVEVLVDDAVPVPDEFQVNELSCSGLDDGFIQILNVSGGTPPFDYTINGQSSDDAIFENLAAGDYMIQLTDAIGCEWDTTITLNQPEQVDIDLGEDQLVVFGDPVTINAQITNDYDSIMWSPEGSLPCSDCIQQQFIPEESLTVVATVINEFGCTATDTVTIRVKRDYNVYVPNVFSPDEDGVNDRFIIYTADDVDEIEELYIYTRWGEPVFETFNIPPNDPQYGWDGTLLDEPLNPGVYVYHAVVRFQNDVRITVSGDVTLLR